MNGRQIGEFLSAAAACDPRGDYEPAASLVAAVAAAAPTAEWEAAVCGGNASVLRLALRSGAGEARALLARALSLDEAALSGRPAFSRPWVDATWSAGSGRWTHVDVASRELGRDRLRAASPKSGPAQTLSTRRFSTRAFPEPISSALKAFDALVPIASLQAAAGRTCWSLIPAKTLPWPLFLRCDLAAAFAPRAAMLSLLLRDAPIVALDFDGRALWARCE